MSTARGELVRLYADKADHGAVRLFQAADQLVEADDRIGLVDHIDIDLYVVTERLPPAAVVDQVIDGCKGFEGIGERTHWMT